MRLLPIVSMLREALIVARVVAIAFGANCAMAAAAAVVTIATTTVTTYEYNADGAATAITTQVGSAAATIEYLTWDNFVPDAGEPTTGTVTAANGNLTGVGSSPEVPSTAFSFDRRSRLLSYSTGGSAVAYGYHPDGMLESAGVADDGWIVYPGQPAARRIANLRQQSSDSFSAWLGDLRHVSSGGAEALMTPRKDVAATYDVSAETLTPYRYDGYGADGDAAAASYVLEDNPFRYAGEMRDPVSGAYYLRARWYVPEVPSFVARDPLAHLNRYGYAAGNPVMNVDPSGMRSRSIFDDLRDGLEWLDSGVQGHLARVFLAPALGALEIVANPRSFWESLKTNYEGSDVYFALGIAGQVASGGLFSIGTEAVTAIGFGERALSIAQTVTTSVHHGRLEANDLLESSEELIGSLAYEKAFEKMHDSRERAGQSSESNVDPRSRAVSLANATREAADRVRITVRHRARLDLAKKARAATRAVSTAEDDAGAAPRRDGISVPRAPLRALSLLDDADTWELSRSPFSGARREQSSPDPVAEAAGAGTSLRNECRDSVRDVLRLLAGT